MYADENDRRDLDLKRLRMWGWVVFYVLSALAMIWVVLR